MIPIERIGEPAVLAENRDTWTQKYLEKRATSPGERPSSKQYAHPDIVAALRAAGR